MKGRVAILRDYGTPVELVSYDVPDPEPGGMVLKMVQAGICGTDLHVWRGDTRNMPGRPSNISFGHEGFGVVYKLGKGVTTDDAGEPLREGDRVIPAMGRASAGRPTQPGVLRTFGEFPYFTSTFGDYYYIPADRPVFKVPDTLPDGILAPVNCAMSASIHALNNGRVTFGSNVVIFGAGGVGLIGTAAARDMGAQTVIVLDRIPARLQLAKEFGADHVINIDEYATPEARVQRVHELTRGHGADAVLEMVGSPTILPEGVEMLGRDGTFVEMGVFFPGVKVQLDPVSIFRLNRRIVGSGGIPVAQVKKTLDFLVRNQGKWPFEKIVSHSFKLADINEAFARTEWNQKEPTVTRAVLVP